MISFAFQIGLILVGILIPLLNPELLPKTQLTSFLVAPPPPPPPPPPPAPAPVEVKKVVPRQFDAGKLTAPKQVPKEIAKIEEADLPPPSGAVGVVGGVPGGVPGAAGGVIGGILGGLPSNAPPPPPPPKPAEAPKPPKPSSIKVGGQVMAAKLIRQPKPVYPPLAKQARIQGVVRLSAIIGKDGTIQSLQVVTGHPLLQQAALEAVRNWVYQPTLLNGDPVDVVTTIDVNFTLSQ